MMINLMHCAAPLGREIFSAKMRPFGNTGNFLGYSAMLCDE